ncbi:hypothetical protein POR1_78 [Pseudomonas phage POR1]|uniref:Uncharacterized protein n=1 Tax=Pseudomonas phage POR1 TaxID=1718594 RepID=A0A0N9SHA0_9CAUD|nr:hypothetical protein POR1_78 [Pseudomonas phage POR1]
MNEDERVTLNMAFRHLVASIEDGTIEDPRVRDTLLDLGGKRSVVNRLLPDDGRKGDDVLLLLYGVGLLGVKLTGG